MDVLIEINAGEEAAKSGVLPDLAEALAVQVTGGQFPHLRLRGFMTMAPKCADDAQYRGYFSSIRDLSLRIWSKLPMRDTPMVLSMGMSESYVPAAMEGATIVRVGRSLFAKPE